MTGEDLAVLTHDDRLGIGVHIHRPTHRACLDAVAVVIETYQAGLGDGGGLVAVTIERTAIGNQRGTLYCKHLGDRTAWLLGMGFAAGVAQAARLQPPVQLGKALETQPRREQPVTERANLVLHLSLLPPRSRRARHRLHQVIAHQLFENGD